MLLNIRDELKTQSFKIVICVSNTISTTILLDIYCSTPGSHMNLEQNTISIAMFQSIDQLPAGMQLATLPTALECSVTVITSSVAAVTVIPGRVQ